MTVFPPGGKAGSTVEVAWTGTDLEEPDQLVFSHPGIKAEPIVPPAPPVDPKKPPVDPKKPPMPVVKPPITKFKVTIPANVAPGCYDVRLVNRWGVSNARAFIVGDLNEVEEKEPNNDVMQAQKIELNSTVNGSLAGPTDVDYVVFAGKKGQRVVFACLTSSIDSRMTAGVEVYDARDRLLARSRNYEGNDAVTDCTLPEDGDYYVRIYEFTHTGGNQEYFYRLTVTTGPWIDAVFPPVVEPGKPTQVTVYGRNLPGGQADPTAVEEGSVLEKATIQVTPPAAGTLAFNGNLGPASSMLDGFEVRVRNAVGTSNPYLVTLGQAPVVLEKPQPNDTAETAQEVTVPCEIAGRIEKRRDRDWYVFSAKKGDILSLELYGDRIGSPGDLYFILRSGDGKQTIVEQDDNNDAMGNKFHARTQDPATYKFTAPADGKYQLMITSRTANLTAGPRCVYRMRIAPEQPDFRLVVVGADGNRPEAGQVRQGGNGNFSVFAWRHDGFNGDITLSIDGLPAGVTAPPQVLGSGLRQTMLVVSAAPAAAVWTGEIKIKGTAVIGGKAVVHEARPAAIVWPTQQQQPAFNRMERSTFLAVRPGAPWSLVATADKAEVSQGDKVTITAKLTRILTDFKQPLQVQANIQSQGPPNYLPQGLNIPQANIAPDKTEAPLAVTIPTNTPPGVYNIVLTAQAQVPYNKDPMSKTKPNVLMVQPSTPLTLVIIPKTLATLSTNVGKPNLKPGEQTTVSVRVDRQFGYDGEFKVKLELPPGVTGLSADEVTVPAGKPDVMLVVKATPNAVPGARNNLIVKATALFNGKTPVVHETKINVNVVK